MQGVKPPSQREGGGQSLRQPSQAQLRLWARLDTVKVRRREGIFLVEGLKVTTELLVSGWEVRAILLEQKRPRWEKLLAKLPASIDAYLVPARQWRKLSQDKHSEGIMAVAAVPPHWRERALRAVGLANFVVARAGGTASGTWPDRHGPLPDAAGASEGPHESEEGRQGTGTQMRAAATHAADKILLLYEVNDPANLGTILRTAAWFGFKAVLLSTRSVDATHPKAVRASMGGLFHVQLAADLDFGRIIPVLKSTYRIVAGDLKGEANPHPCSGPTAVLLGSESHGLPHELLTLADERWYITGSGRGESLSLPQAAAILLYECSKR